MKYIPSINIEQTKFDKQSYIITPNALGVVGNIVDSFNTGIHSILLDHTVPVSPILY